MTGRKAPEPQATERISKTFTLPPLLVRLIAYYRVDGGFKSESHAAEALIQAGLDAEDAKAKAERAAAKGRAA